MEKIDVNAQFDFDGTVTSEELFSDDEVEMSIKEFREYIKLMPENTTVNITFGRKVD